MLNALFHTGIQKIFFFLLFKYTFFVFRLEYEARNKKKEAKEAAVYEKFIHLKTNEPESFHTVNLNDC